MSLTIVIDYGTKEKRTGSKLMEEIAISKFKATCLATLERVRRTRRPIRVTKFGEPIAEVVPPTPKQQKKDWIGSMAGTIRINGDIISPAIDEKDWEVLNS
jgi:antitoxin (DNA-binding transcriptional repressor) of toxin-antitoxin stability system